MLIGVCFSVNRRPSELALRQAKINVIKSYLLVGVTEEFEDFLFVLAKVLPEFFNGIQRIYEEPGLAGISIVTST